MNSDDLFNRFLRLKEENKCRIFPRLFGMVEADEDEAFCKKFMELCEKAFQILEKGEE